MSLNQPDGFLALPDGGRGAPVLVVHPWWGLNTTIKNMCTRLAAAGFVVFAPDLYHGTVTAVIDEANELVRALDYEAASADVAAAIAYLDEQAGRPAGGLATIGFSMGAWYAAEASTQFPERVRAVVLYYGAVPGDYSGAQASFLGHFAENDPYEEQEYVEATEADLRRDGRPVALQVYPGTTHWFAEADRADAYDEAAAELAWQRTVAFLNETIGQGS
ncbi:MAG: dienelactone hydrolase family protein [Candidatus Promineofilum sp.]|nr:dienelactone hydrolase family protein [Promineifilum sp.]